MTAFGEMRLVWQHGSLFQKHGDFQSKLILLCGCYPEMHLGCYWCLNE